LKIGLEIEVVKLHIIVRLVQNHQPNKMD